jgi:hypothetical protein
VSHSTDWMRAAPGRDRAVPSGVDVTKASIARVYNYVLGGKDNFAVDRKAAEAFIRVVPQAPLIARDNRAFVRRAVRYLVGEAGVRQIIDIGSGLPTAGNVHEIAHEVNPSTRVVYVDIDPVVLAHARALLADDDTTVVVSADVREPESIFDHPTTRGYIDEGEPFAVLATSILHHLSDAQRPERIAAAIRDRLPSGGYLVIANFVDSGEPRARALERAFLEGGLGTGRFRTREEQIGYFDGLDMVDPGFVFANDWRPDADTPTDSPVRTLYIGGVARKA